MRAKTTLTILMTVALMASTVAVGHAGGGGAGGGAGTIVLQCYEASGPNAPQILTVDDQFINPTTEKLGKLKMICSFNPSSQPTANSPDGFHALPQFDSFACYEAPGANSKSTVSYTDNVFASPQTAKLGPSQVFCTVACSNPNGCAGPAGP